jgi:hypothetical protein
MIEKHSNQCQQNLTDHHAITKNYFEGECHSRRTEYGAHLFASRERISWIGNDAKSGNAIFVRLFAGAFLSFFYIFHVISVERGGNSSLTFLVH